MRGIKDAGFYVLILLVFFVVVAMIVPSGMSNDMKYSDVLKQIEAGNVKGIVLDGEKSIVTVELRSEIDDTKQLIYEASIMPDITTAAETFQRIFEEGKIDDYSSKPLTTYPVWLSFLVPGILVISMVIFFVIFMRQSSGGGAHGAMSFGKSRAKLMTEVKKAVTFKDVAGADEEKEELTEIVGFLKNPQKYTDLGARVPKGVLLVGPPGTGKTLLAKAVAGEAGVPFFSISGSDFVEMYVGVGASRVRDLFEQAKKQSPCIVFIDEIDAVGRHRGAGLGGGHDEREQTLNQLLVEMDGFGLNEGVIILAATNRPDILDPALLRPGRFDRRVVVGYPDIKGREEILKVHSNKKPLASDVDLKEIAKMTQGFTGADLENLLNESALLAVRNGKKFITMDEIKEASYKVVMGPEKKSRVVSEKARKLTAYHEAGHAIVVKIAAEGERVDRVTIIPSGNAGGYTSRKQDEEREYYTKNNLIGIIKVALGGRAAEQLVLGEISTGASSDLKHANGLARDLIMKYGMSEEFPNIIFGNEENEVFIGKDFGTVRNYSEATATVLDNEIKKIIHEAYDDVIEILKDNRERLDTLAEVLLEKEKVEEEEFNAIFEEGHAYYERMMVEREEQKRAEAEKKAEDEKQAKEAEEKEADEAAQKETSDKEDGEKQ